MADDVQRFQGLRRSVSISERVWLKWHTQRQLEADQPESFGVLIGSTSHDHREIYIEDVTKPMPGDCQSRTSFDLRDPGHQHAVNAAHRGSDGYQIYLGTWHTHPEPIPSPSRTDKVDWHRCLRRNSERSLIFVIAGTEQI